MMPGMINKSDQPVILANASSCAPSSRQNRLDVALKASGNVAFLPFSLSSAICVQIPCTKIAVTVMMLKNIKTKTPTKIIIAINEVVSVCVIEAELEVVGAGFSKRPNCEAPLKKPSIKSKIAQPLLVLKKRFEASNANFNGFEIYEG